MSGSRHHFIPQFLLRGFASTRGRDAAYAWVFPRGRKPYNTNVLNIAVEGHFYTHDGESTVDDLITAAEGPLGNLVDRLRTSESAAAASDAELATLFAHFEVRTRHIRQNFELMGSFLIDRVIALVNDEKWLSSFVARRILDDPSYIRNELERELRARGIDESLISQIAPIALSNLPALLPQFLPGAMAQLSQSFGTLICNGSSPLKKIVRNAQLGALKDSVAPEGKANLYAGLQFRVLKHPQGGLPLGDSAVVAHVQDSKEFKSFVNKDDRLIAVYLPLTPNLVLCGQRPSIDPLGVDLARVIARCSFDSFIAIEPTARLEELQDQIGTDAHLMTEEEMESILKRSLDEVLHETDGGRGAS